MGQTEMEHNFFEIKTTKNTKIEASFRSHFLISKTGPHDVATTTGRTEKWSQKLNHGMRFFFLPDACQRFPQVTTFFVWCNWPIACVPLGKTPVFVDLDEKRVKTDLPYKLFRSVADIAAGLTRSFVISVEPGVCACMFIV